MDYFSFVVKFFLLLSSLFLVLVSKLCPALVTQQTVAYQAPLSLEFPRQEYWSGLPLPSPGDLPDPGIKPMSPALAGRFFPAEPQGKPINEREDITY